MKKQCKLIGFEGIDVVKFDISRQAVRSSLNIEYNEILRNEFAENTSDYYSELGIFIEYSKDNRCQAIEFTDDCEVGYQDIELFSLDCISIAII